VTTELVTFDLDRAAHVARITLRRPAAANAISADMAAALRSCLDVVESDDDIKTVVLAGDGEHLCGGWDASELWSMYTRAPGGSVGRHPSQRARLIALDELWWGPRGIWSRLLRCRKVTILDAHGHCYEAGLYLALCCDLVVAASDTTFANPRWRHVGVDGDMSLLIATVGLKRAKEMMYCGAHWSADVALRYGLVDWVADGAERTERIESLAAAVSSIVRDGIVTEKYAVFASLEKLGVGHSFAAATVVGASMSNLYHQPGEFNALRVLRDRGVAAGLRAAAEHAAGYP
jgi:enoyl-CoA hydratase